MVQATSSELVRNTTTAELRQYMGEHHEGEYLLIDVRQPEEYEQGHIPGARLMPLGELESGYGEELDKVADRTLVFYCRSGGRSARACTWASRVRRLPKVVNLLGGFSAWEGIRLPDYPRLSAFSDCKTPAEMLTRALQVEKGTHVLYQLLAKEFADSPVAKIFTDLSLAEVSHGKTVYNFLSEVSSEATEEFEIAFEKAGVSLVENGESHAVLVERARALGKEGTMAILELALQIELGAFDLYKSLAAEARSADARVALMDLAQHEKQHAEMVLRALGEVTT